MAVVTGTAAVVTSLRMMGQALLKSLAKKATMATVKKAAKQKAKDFVVNKAKDKIKSKFRKKKVKGKDIARKILGGGEEGGGTTFGSMGGPIVPSSAGQLVPTGEVSIVKTQAPSKQAAELGLVPFITSLDTVKNTTDKIVESLNNNLKDAKKRTEKQRLLNAAEARKDKEEGLESTMAGRILKRPVKAAKDAADNFLSRLLKFFLYGALGMLINALMGGARDIIKIFLLGIKAVTMAWPTIKNFFKGIFGSVGNVFKAINNAFTSIKNGVVGLFKKVGTAIFNWIKNTIQAVGKAIKNFVKSAWNFVKNPIKNTGKVFNKIKNSPIGKTLSNAGKRVRNFIKNPIKSTKNIIKNVKKSSLGKGVKNLSKNFKNLSKNFKKTPIGKAIKGKKGSALLKGGGKKIEKITKGGWFKGIKNWAGNAWKQGAKWAKQIGNIAKLATQPAKLAEMVKKTMSGKVTKLLEKNKTIGKLMKMVKNPKKLASGIKNFLKNAKKSKGLMNLKGALGKATKLKIGGVDAVLASIMGLIDYAAFGEAPINAIMRATGSLVGYTAGFAIGAPFGGVPGFITGMAGGWAGEKASDVLTAALAATPGIKDLKDPIMNDGRPLVRNPFGGANEGDRAEQVEEFGKGKSMGETMQKQKEDKAREIAASTSYEEGGEEEPTIIIESGSEIPSTGGGSKAGKGGFMPLPSIDNATLLNSQYNLLFKTKTYKG